MTHRDTDDRTMRERVAAARTQNDVVSILGRRRITGYTVGFLVVALAATASIVYLILEVGIGSKSAWVLAALPAPLFLLWFCGSIAYAFGYFIVTGRRWPGANRLGAIAARFNSNI